PRQPEARLLSIRLAVEAWQLDWAAEQAEALLAGRRRDPEGALLLARIRLLQGGAAEALAWAPRAQQWTPGNAAPHRVEGEIHLAEDRIPQAEASLRRALELDPFDADARFTFGYVLWLREAPAPVAAVAQWELALEADPLHFRAHWHLGNGYTAQDYR